VWRCPKSVVSILAAAACLAGCATYEYADEGRYLIAASYAATDALIAGGRPHLDPGRPIIVATVVDIDDLDRSSTLGRHLSEAVSARFTQNQYQMIEMKLQSSVYMKRDEGELMLTRQVRQIANAHGAQAVVVGTYSRANSTVLVNLKVVRPESNIVIAAHDYPLVMTRDVCTLLTRDARNCAERWEGLAH
jgi:TolB-like protein